MSAEPIPAWPEDATPVDDVRRVRVKLSRAAGDDLSRLADEATRIARTLRDSLGLRPVTAGSSRRPGTENSEKS